MRDAWGTPIGGKFQMIRNVSWKTQGVSFRRLRINPAKHKTHKVSDENCDEN